MTNLKQNLGDGKAIDQTFQLSPLQVEFIDAVKSYISYIKNVRRYSPNTVSSYKRNLAQFGEYVFTLEINSINEITLKMLRRFIVQLAEALYKPVTINHKIHCYSSFFRHCMRMGLMKHNNAKLLHQLKTLSKLTDYLSEEEMNKIYTEVEFPNNFIGVRNLYIIDLFYSSGIRLRELINLKEKDIHGDMLKVVQGKGGRDRLIPLPGKFVEYHQVYLEAKDKFYKKRKIKKSDEEPLIVTSKYQKAYPMLIQRIIKKSFSFVKDKTVSPHVLRHTYATHLMNAGAPIYAIKDLLGHESVVSTSRYTHVSIGKLVKIHSQIFTPRIDESNQQQSA